MTNPDVRRGIVAGLDGIELRLYSYAVWEEEFIDYWGATPTPLDEHRQLVQEYVNSRKLNIASMTFSEAARTFHIGALSFPRQDLFVRFTVDYNKVQPELAEEVLTDEDQEGLEKQEWAYFPETRQQGVQFDMGRQSARDRRGDDRVGD